ncbi:MAG: peptidoglycan-associated lipoprotein Pal [bacterium]|jgi:peptidoglycan-associated lipoprotein
MRAFWIAVLCAMLAACASTSEQSPAGVEDRKPGAEARGVEAGGPSGVGLTAAQRAALTDPSSPLSKRSIFYDFDKYDVKAEYRPLVEAHGNFLRENPGMKVLIQGNTDERGSREYNIALGQRRSDGVKRMLLLLGAREDQVESVSLGEEKPRAAGSSEDAWAQNRRSDILYQGEY